MQGVPTTQRKLTKLFILDTNVILHDSGCIRCFADNDIAIPITVLEELDKFKKGNGDINFHAREFLRQLDALTGDVLSERGAPLESPLGSIRIVLSQEMDPRLKMAFLHDAPDHRILNTTMYLARQEPERPTILVSKDSNLRIKAKALGIAAQDYNTDKAESFDKLYTGKRTISNVPGSLVDLFYEDKSPVAANQLELIENPLPNENFILRNGSKSALATFSSNDQSYNRISKRTAFGITSRNAEQAFALSALLNDDIKLVTLAGKAGSGKTLLTLAAALECKSRYRQILLARPTVPLSNRDLGFLPGDLGAKLDPYMQPLYDNLSVIKDKSGNGNQADRIQEMLENQKLEITPLAYIRGRSLQRIFFIVDEAQNMTPHEIKTVITRCGEGTKIIFTGDIHQIDHPYLDSLSNGLTYLINRMVGQSIYAHITLEKSERSPLAELASELL